MASDKDKRFRVHVVKELYETERDYTQQLEFTVTHILQKAREKSEYDKDKLESEKSFTPERIQTLFCNIEDILAFHKELLTQLESCMGSKGPAYDTEIASCFVRQKERFSLYKEYGECNEPAQKLLYELYEKPVFKAFFVACMLLGGKSDEDISGLVFKPIQRICKYPLLFRELSKYTPVGHPDYEATQEALAIMRDVCSVINEAKRRVEKLEEIADWQAIVESWEGTNVIDTCNHLVKEGPLIKISAGNTQERQFHLFDNLLVYCKKTTQLLSASKGKGKGLLFRGRVPVSNLDIEDIEDGTSDYYTNGIAVNNSWKVHNVAKNKWFVLVAGSAEEKQSWMDAIRKEKEKRKRQQAALAQNNRALALDKGEKIYYQMRRDKFMKDHKSRLRTYPNTFSGQEFVGWLVEKEEAADNGEAVLLGQAFLENGVIHHISDRHQFKNDRDLLYRFRYDDGTFRSKINSSDVTARGIRLYLRLYGQFESLIKGQKVAVGLRTMSTMKSVVSSQKLIDWWQAEKDIHSRQAGVDLGQELFATGFVRHATDEQNFKDGTFLYRFTADDGHEGHKDAQRRLTGTPSRIDFNVVSVSTCRTITLPYLEADQGGYGLELSDSHPVTVKTVSPEAQLHGVCEGQLVLAINGIYTTALSHANLLSQLRSEHRCPPPLTLLISRPGSSEYATLTPSAGGLGFHIKGNSPVIIHGVDKGFAASQAGIIPGCCILKVGEEDVLKASHEVVVSAVRGSLSRSKAEQGKCSVRLKLSYPFLEQLSLYKYECADTTLVEVFERTVESPYTFSLPAQLLKLYAVEADHVISLVSESGVTNEKVTAYLKELKGLSTAYAKISMILSIPRWPSYKLYGSGNSPILEPCPTNLHTSILDVITGASPSPPSSPTTPNATVSQDEDEPEASTQITSYLISSMAIPSLNGHNITARSGRAVLTDETTRRELVRGLTDRVAEMEKDHESIKRMMIEIQGSPESDTEQPNEGELNHCELSFSLSPPIPSYLRTDITPSSSPVMARRRIVSISNPVPILKLVVEGLLQKTEALLKSLEDRLLLSVLDDTAGILVPTGRDLIDQLCKRLTAQSEEVKMCTQRPGESLGKAVSVLIDTTHKCINDLCVRLWISLALIDSVPLLETRDKVFSQCLVSVVTSFAHSLVKAIKGQLNPGVEYENKNQDASRQWLQMVAKKGLLVHMQSTMLPNESSELSSLRDLQFIHTQLSSVVFHVTDTASPQHLPCTHLPPVTIKGSRDHLHVYYQVPRQMCDELPEKFRSESGIQIIPVLFNKGLVSLEEGETGYEAERALNMESFKHLKKYYQGLRAFRLDKSNLPSDSDAKLVAIHQISQPLNAMDILVRQVEVAVKEPTRPGVGLLSLAAEVATRIGALRINVCDSGVFRSGLATSLEQVMVLGRCHGLPFKCFRTTLNRVRRKGGFSYIVRKNNADISKSLPTQPPKLYQLPPDTREA